jgi:hypothetical protein
LLDHHVSGERVGAPLRSAGHDITALDQYPELQRMTDFDILAKAASEQRIVVTLNVRHFEPLLRQWAEAEQTHFGCILVHGLAHHEFGRIIRGIERLLADRPFQEQWANLALYLSAAQTSP